MAMSYDPARAGDYVFPSPLGTNTTVYTPGTSAETPRQGHGRQSTYPPSHVFDVPAQPPATPANWSSTPIHNVQPLSTVAHPNSAPFTIPRLFSSPFYKPIPSDTSNSAARRAFNASVLNNCAAYQFNPANVLTAAPINLNDPLVAPRPAPSPAPTPVSSTLESVTLNGVRYVKAATHAKPDSATSAVQQHQPPTCMPDEEEEIIAGPSRGKGKARADSHAGASAQNWERPLSPDNIYYSDKASFSPTDDEGYKGDVDKDVTAGASWYKNPPRGTIENPIQVSGFFNDELVPVLVGTCAIHEYKVLKSAVSALLIDPKFQAQKNALQNGNPVILEGVDGNVFQNMITCIYGGYPDCHGLEVMKGYTSYKLVSLYEAASYFGLQELTQEIIYVLETRKTSMDFFDLARDVYARGKDDQDFRGLVRRKVADILDRMTSPAIGSWDDIDTSFVKKKFTDGPIPLMLRQDILEVLIDRETARVTAMEAKGPAEEIEVSATWAGQGLDEASEAVSGDGRAEDDWNQINTPNNYQVDADGKDDKTLFITGFPSSYNGLQIVSEIMLFASDNVDANDVNISFARSDNSNDRRYVHITFTNPEDAIAVFENLSEKSMGVGSQAQPIFVDWSYDFVAQNFVRFAAWKNGESKETNRPSQSTTMAVAIKDSNNWDCSLKFKAGDRLTNVSYLAVPPRSTIGNEWQVPVLIGFFNGVRGTFPATYVEIDYANSSTFNMIRDEVENWHGQGLSNW